MTKIFFLALVFCQAFKLLAIDGVLINTEAQLIELRKKSLLKQIDLREFVFRLKKRTFTKDLKTISKVLIADYKESWTEDILSAFSGMQWPVKVPKAKKPKWGLVEEDKKGYRIYILFRNYEKDKKGRKLIGALYQIYIFKKNLKKLKKHLKRLSIKSASQD